MKFKYIVFMLVGIVSIGFASWSKDQIRVVGSSTVYPFASAVAEELGAVTKYKTPVVESTGSGGGMKLFCKGVGKNTPDITNASRKMKKSEFKLCQKNGVNHITEVMIGYDGIAFAQSAKNKPFSITKKQLLLAVAKEVPNKDGTKLIKNPYTNWNQIDPSLENRKIVIYGPPTSSGTRDAFEDMILKAQTKKMQVYGFKKYHKIRDDGIYIPSGENDNLIVQKLDKDREAFGIFGYSFLEENEDKVQASLIDGIKVTPKNISDGKYPLARSLFFYIKNDHLKHVESLNEYIKLFISESMIGEDGELSDIGLIPLDKAQRAKIQKRVLNKEELSEADFK